MALNKHTRQNGRQSPQSCADWHLVEPLFQRELATIDVPAASEHCVHDETIWPDSLVSERYHWTVYNLKSVYFGLQQFIFNLKKSVE